MKAFWYLVWIIVIIGGSIIGNAADPSNRYIIGFIVGCLATAALRLAKEWDE